MPKISQFLLTIVLRQSVIRWKVVVRIRESFGWDSLVGGLRRVFLSNFLALIAASCKRSRGYPLLRKCRVISFNIEFNVKTTGVEIVDELKEVLIGAYPNAKAIINKSLPKERLGMVSVHKIFELGH